MINNGDILLWLWFGGLLGAFILGWQANNLMWWIRDRREAKKALSQKESPRGT